MVQVLADRCEWSRANTTGDENDALVEADVLSGGAIRAANIDLEGIGDGTVNTRLEGAAELLGPVTEGLDVEAHGRVLGGRSNGEGVPLTVNEGDLDLCVLTGLVIESLGDTEFEDVTVLEDCVLSGEEEFDSRYLPAAEEPVDGVEEERGNDPLVGFRNLSEHTVDDEEAEEKSGADDMSRIEEAEVVLTDGRASKNEHDTEDDGEQETSDDAHVEAPETPVPGIPGDEPDEMEGTMDENGKEDCVADDDVEGRESGIERQDELKRRVAKLGEKQARGEEDHESGVEVKGVAHAAGNADEPTDGLEVGHLEVVLEGELGLETPSEHEGDDGAIEGKEEDFECVGGEVGLDAGAETGDGGLGSGNHCELGVRTE